MSYLETLSISDIENGPFPFERIVNGSIFYSATGLKSEIIKDSFSIQSDNTIQNIIYCDNHYGGNGRYNDVAPIDGYRLIAERKLSRQEIFPNAVIQNDLIYCDLPNVFHFLENDWNKSEIGNIYINWLVYELVDDIELKTPKRYSIIHIESYGTNIYRLLYHNKHLIPSVLVIKQPSPYTGNGLDFPHYKIRKVGLHEIVVNNYNLNLPEYVYYVELDIPEEDDGFGWSQYEIIDNLKNDPRYDLYANVYKYKLNKKLDRRYYAD